MALVDIEFDKVVNLSTCICLEIDGSRIRILQFDSAKKNVYNLRYFQEKVFAETLVKDSSILDPAAVGKELSEMLSSAHPRLPSTENVILLIPQSQSFFITMELPGVAKDELRSIITNRIAELLPMEVKEVYWDWHRIGNQNNKTRVQLAAVSKKIIDNYMAMLKAAKLTALLFIPREVASANLLQTIDSTLSKNCVLLDVDQSSLVLSVVSNNEVTFSTNINTGPINASVNVRMIVQAISSAIQYCFGQTQDINSVPILLHGITEKVDVLLPAFEKLGIKAERINYQIEDQDTKSYLDSQHKDEYIAIMGGAVKGIAKGDPNTTSINLVPDVAKVEYRRSQLSQVLKKYLLFILLNLILLIFLGLAVSFWLTGQFVQTAERKASFQRVSESERISEIEGVINNLNTNSGQIQKVTSSIYQWDRVLATIAEITPAGITIDSLAIEKDPLAPANVLYWLVTVSGTAINRQDVLNMADQMRQKPIFQSVVLPLGSLESGTNVEFTLEAQLPFKSLL